MSKPWMETWEVGPSPDGHGEVNCGDGVWVSVDHDSRHDTGDTRFPTQHRKLAAVRLIAAAPALVRVLLAMEWTGGAQAGIGDGCDPCCPACTEEPREEHRGYPLLNKPAYTTGGVHALDCTLDAALTLAGLDTQEKRDEARREIARPR